MSRPAPPEIASYAGGAVAIGSSLTLTEIGVIIGIATAILTFAFNAFYMYRKDKREQLETAAKIKSIEAWK